MKIILSLFENFLNVPPFSYQTKNHVSPLYSVKVFDILQRKRESYHTHAILIELLQTLHTHMILIESLVCNNFLVRCLIRLDH